MNGSMAINSGYLKTGLKWVNQHFCAHIVVNTMELYASVIQMRDLVSYKTRFNAPLSTQGNAYTKLKI